MKLSVQSFKGIAPTVNPRYLPEGMAQIAVNCDVKGQSLRPLSNPSDALDSTNIDLVTNAQTLYRFGQDVTNETQYWLSWPGDIDVCRGQIAGDAAEWTFYTGDGYPKATNNELALGGSTLPNNAVRLGLPAPVTALTATAGSATQEEFAAKVVLSAGVIETLGTASLLRVSVDGGENYQRVDLSGGADAAGVASAINAQTVASATVVGTTVEVTYGLGDGARLSVVYGELETRTVSGEGNDALAGIPASITLPAELSDEIGQIEYRLSESADWVRIAGAVVTCEDGDESDIFGRWCTVAYQAATGLRDDILDADVSDDVTPEVPGDGTLIIKTVATGPDAQLFLRVSDVREGVSAYYFNSKEYSATGQEAEDQTATLLLTATALGTISVADGLQLSTDNDTWTSYSITDRSPSTVAAALNADARVNAVLDAGGVRVSAATEGPGFLGVRYFVERATELTGTGYAEDLGVPESRVYTWTWIWASNGLVMESAPAPPSDPIDVYPGAEVVLTGFDATPADGALWTGRRIYRATAGTFLFVPYNPDDPENSGDWPASVPLDGFTDTASAEQLAEALPSLNWSMPPETLAGLINLPNGVMAGFTGRDVYFCEPYRPYAWPEDYILSIDAPIVGLGRMDTTLAVLTQGNPYFIQGPSPDLMTVVKADIEQACVSKQSIVSLSGSVIYASPDGLMMLSSNGSRMLTQELFDAKDWQALLDPASIEAYGHDNQYIAFCTFADGSEGGFLYDLTSGQFTLHDQHYPAGYTDLRNDALYLRAGTELVKWDQGTTTGLATWRSKVFTMPQILGFSCAQVEAENYTGAADALTFNLYVDGVLSHTQVVISRDPFRLPVAPGRDFEIELITPYEIFAVTIAQSMQELASG